MKTYRLKIAALCLAALTLACVLPLNAFAAMRDGQNSVYIITRDPTAGYDLRTLAGVKAYLLNDEETDINPDQYLKSVSVVYDVPETEEQAIRIELQEKDPHAEMLYDVSDALRRSEDVLYCASYRSAPETDDDLERVLRQTGPTLAAGGETYRTGDLAVKISARNVRDMKKCIFTLRYNAEIMTPELCDGSGNSNSDRDYGALPFFNRSVDLSSPGVITMTFTPAVFDDVAPEDYLAAFIFRIQKAGDTDFRLAGSVEYQDGRTVAISRLNNKLPQSVEAPYPRASAGELCSVSVDGKSFCAIRNEYFAKNYNLLLENAYSAYNLALDAMDQPDPPLISMPTSDCVYHGGSDAEDHFVMLIFDDAAKDAEETYAAFNQRMLAALQDGVRETLYVADHVPCVVVSAADPQNCRRAFLQAESVAYVTEPFRINYSGFSWGMVCSPDPKRAFTAAKARELLRRAAGLEVKIPVQAEPLYHIYYDLDRDNKLTSRDARLALRLAARLDPYPRFYADEIYVGREDYLYTKP